MAIEASPNFFIVGAPKSGTTALYTWLRKNPAIFMPSLKEPKFFAADICHHQRRVTTLPEYLALFKEARVNVIGEASTCYLASRRAPFAIREFCPEARIIVLIRNPVDVMQAQHSERMFAGSEHISDFAMALDSQVTRKWRSGRFRGERVMRSDYRELVRFSEQIERYFDVFGRDCVHVAIYDDLARDPQSVCENVLRFLRVSQSTKCGFQVINANKQVRSVIVQDLLRRPPGLVRKIVRTLLPAEVRHVVGTSFHRLNVEVTPRQALEQSFRQRLLIECKPDIQRLCSVLNRDLSNWFAGCN